MTYISTKLECKGGGGLATLSTPPGLAPALVINPHTYSIYILPYLFSVDMYYNLPGFGTKIVDSGVTLERVPSIATPYTDATALI